MPDVDPFTLSPEAASAELARMTEAYRGGPVPTTPTNAAEAARLLESRMADPKWSERVTKGDGPAVAEFNRLSEQARHSTPDTAIETVDAVGDPNAVSRAAYDTMLDGLREQGLPESGEQYIRDLDSGKRTDRPTAGDGAACRQALDRLTRDADFARKVLAGDSAASALRTKLGNVVALAADDGKPISTEVAKTLEALGLR
jgi:hypothetical protein